LRRAFKPGKGGTEKAQIHAKGQNSERKPQPQHQGSENFIIRSWKEIEDGKEIRSKEYK